MEWLLLLAGLAALLIGGEFFVKGASNIASILGLPPLVIGLTVVAFGTSAPELGVSIGAAVAGKSSIAVSNVVGSNIMNILLILGASALISPLKVHFQLIRLDVPVMIAASILLIAFSWNGEISHMEAILLLLIGIFYTTWIVIQGKKETKAEKAANPEKEEVIDKSVKTISLSAFYIVFGLICLVLGSQWTITSASSIAAAFGVSERVIGLTIVACGTSLPELVTSIIAAFRKNGDIAIGNVVGSNIFNILYIIGISSLFTSTSLTVVPELKNVDLPFMLFVAVLCLPIFIWRKSIKKAEGALFLSLYGGYLWWLIQS